MRVVALALGLLFALGCGGGAGLQSGSAEPALVAQEDDAENDAEDSDGDGVRGDADACPNEAEDRDAWEDEDGCPDPDNDADGIPDVDDQCPNEASHRSRSASGRGEYDDGGCPTALGREYTDGPPGDLDNDGYPDDVDQCPRHAETFPSSLDGGCTDDGDGCPDGGSILLIACEISILESIAFDSNRSTLDAEAVPILDALARTLLANPQLTVDVVGHVDDRERVALAAQRAQAVRDALVSRGVAAERLGLRDQGASRPILPVEGVSRAERAAARERNRRVDFVVTRPPRQPGRPSPGSVTPR